MQNILYPRFPWALLPRMLACAGAGAVIAGVYGIVHDQFTYSISEEYFTRLKFVQFGYANFGFPRRVYVAEIGFLATWWVGFVAGWFIGRIALPREESRKIAPTCAMAFAIMFVIATLGTLSGFLLGLNHGPNYDSWFWISSQLQIADLPSFVRVAYIHNASYAGGFIGLVAALIYVDRVSKKCKPA